MENRKNNAIEKINNVIAKADGSIKTEPMAEEKIKNDSTKKKSRERIKKKKIKEYKKIEKIRNAAIKAQEKASKKSEKEKMKAAKAAERKKNRAKHSPTMSGYFASTVALGAVAVVLSGVLTYTLVIPSNKDSALEGAYKKAFYDVVAEVNNMESDLLKTIVSSDEGSMAAYLSDAAINSELAEINLQTLPLRDENRFYTAKIVNQAGDFSKYLLKKIAKGERPSEQDRQTLKAIYEANRELKNALSEAREKMDGNYSFSSLFSSGKGDVLVSRLNELQNVSVDYPELIYDGPFSDGKEGGEVKGLNYPEITEEAAEKIFTEIFVGYDMESVKNLGEITGQIPCYSFSGKVKGGDLYASITKKGGKLLEFAYAGDCKEVKFNDEYAENKAIEFLNSLGISDVKPVWISLSSDNVYTVNVAAVKDGVILYPDLIKVRVCAYSGMVIGSEATEYYKNHYDREGFSSVISESQAKSFVSEEISVKNSRLTLIPYGQKEERLCYEFCGEYDGDTYFVYIDAENGREDEIFRVIDTTDGALLI